MEPSEAINAYAVAKSSRYRLTDEEADQFIQEGINHNNQNKGD